MGCLTQEERVVLCAYNVSANVFHVMQLQQANVKWIVEDLAQLTNKNYEKTGLAPRQSGMRLRQCRYVHATLHPMQQPVS